MLRFDDECCNGGFCGNGCKSILELNCERVDDDAEEYDADDDDEVTLRLNGCGWLLLLLLRTLLRLYCGKG